ncbi:hypothetical protein TGRH88_085610 [Toxoplasma gondii]|uniref:Uncharacterized protein n=1 Tax=Toxoplasma gondii TaxID=5811 RepID=A0A7J6KFW1_TOXGO|nr:hypothetical protein TGRH88_085610 [Toxoplasma gondii]
MGFNARSMPRDNACPTHNLCVAITYGGAMGVPESLDMIGVVMLSCTGPGWAATDPYRPWFQLIDCGVMTSTSLTAIASSNC